MNLSKRQFIKLGISSSAAALLAPALKPASAFASRLVLPAGYLDSNVHKHWMKLSYNNGLETRQTRRLLGAALRNLGADRGKGAGYLFAIFFDQAVEAAYQRFLATGRKPATLFGLVQTLYNDFILPRTGLAGGQVLFMTLLSILRGRDGTPRGQTAHASYLAYRQAALEYKNAYKLLNDPKAIAAARENRALALQQWQANLQALADLYSRQMAALPPTFLVRNEMLEGLRLAQARVQLPAVRPRLTIAKFGSRVVVSWKGPGRLQESRSVLGPWSDTHQNSPAIFEIQPGARFFRTAP